MKEKTTAIHPVRQDVKVRILPPKEIKTASGIILPGKERGDTFKEILTYEAEVLEVSGLVPTEYTPTVGDIVIVDVFAGVAIPTIEKEQYIKLIPYSMLTAKKTNELQTLDPLKLEPLFERILVETFTPEEEVTESGIIIPGESAKNLYDATTRPAKVIAVSKDIDWVKPGEYIRFEDGVGLPITVNGDSTKYKLIVKYDVLAKVDR